MNYETIFRFLLWKCAAQLSQIIPVLLLPFSWSGAFQSRLPENQTAHCWIPGCKLLGSSCYGLDYCILEYYSSNSKEQHSVFTLKCSEPDNGHVLFSDQHLVCPCLLALLAVSHCGIRSTHGAPWETSSTQFDGPFDHFRPIYIHLLKLCELAYLIAWDSVLVGEFEVPWSSSLSGEMGSPRFGRAVQCVDCWAQCTNRGAMVPMRFP